MQEYSMQVVLNFRKGLPVLHTYLGHTYAIHTRLTVIPVSRCDHSRDVIPPVTTYVCVHHSTSITFFKLLTVGTIAYLQQA